MLLLNESIIMALDVQYLSFCIHHQIIVVKIAKRIIRIIRNIYLLTILNL